MWTTTDTTSDSSWGRSGVPMDTFPAEYTTSRTPGLSEPVLRMLAGVARHSFTRLLPPLGPSIGAMLLPHGGEPAGDEEELAMLRSDPVLAGQALAAANIMQPMGEPVTELADALERLGQGACSALLQASVASSVPMPVPFEEPAERLAAHSVCVAGLARRLARATGASPEEAYAAGLIHDVGRALVLHSLARIVRLPEVAAELEVAGVEAYLDHPIAVQLGRELVRCWALPTVLRESVGAGHGRAPRRGVPALVARAELMVSGGINDHRLSDPDDTTSVGPFAGVLAGLTARAAVA
jgi:hypothetical protein